MCLDEAGIPGCSADLVDKLVGNSSTDWKEQSVVAFRETLQVFATTEVAACGVHVPGLNLAIAWGEYILIKVHSFTT
jgi:superfamily II DNA or RNA helicase